MEGFPWCGVGNTVAWGPDLGLCTVGTRRAGPSLPWEAMGRVRKARSGLGRGEVYSCMLPIW